MRAVGVDRKLESLQVLLVVYATFTFTKLQKLEKSQTGSFSGRNTAFIDDHRRHRRKKEAIFFSKTVKLTCSEATKTEEVGGGNNAFLFI